MPASGRRGRTHRAIEKSARPRARAGPSATSRYPSRPLKSAAGRPATRAKVTPPWTAACMPPLRSRASSAKGQCADQIGRARGNGCDQKKHARRPQDRRQADLALFRTHEDTPSAVAVSAMFTSHAAALPHCGQARDRAAVGRGPNEVGAARRVGFGSRLARMPGRPGTRTSPRYSGLESVAPRRHYSIPSGSWVEVAGSSLSLMTLAVLFARRVGDGVLLWLIGKRRPRSRTGARRSCHQQPQRR